MFNFFLDTSLPIDILRSKLTAYRPGECHPLIDKEQIKRKHNILVTATNVKLHSHALELKKAHRTHQSTNSHHDYQTRILLQKVQQRMRLVNNKRN